MQKSPEDKYPWLDQDDEQRLMTDKESLDKYIDLDNLCLNKEERGKLWICCTDIKKHLVREMR